MSASKIMALYKGDESASANSTDYVQMERKDSFTPKGVMHFFPPELSISQEIGLFKFLHLHSIRGQTIQFIHENTLANYHRLLIYHPPPLEWAFKALLSIVCMGNIGMPVCVCCVYFRQKLNYQLF
jgi:hypothetical protein